MTTTPCTYPEVAIVWGDVETDGLKAHRQILLEVAFVVTDLNLNVLDEDGYQAKILYPAERVARARAQADPFVQNMHDVSGLWSACSDPDEAKPIAQVEAEALAYIQRFVPDPMTARLGGNSVRLDLNFLDEHLPAITNHLHYRFTDVSTVTGLAQWWLGLEAFPKKRAHTAMADIRESISELAYLRANAFRAAAA